jgi:hypothetical protein
MTAGRRGSNKYWMSTKRPGTPNITLHDKTLDTMECHFAPNTQVNAQGVTGSNTL